MPTDRNDLAAACAALIAAAREAGDIALGFFRSGQSASARVETKAGGSPVSEADHAANDFLRARLAAEFPAAAWLSEESADDERRLASEYLLIVDPIDGTRAFIAGDPRWAVSIAYIRQGRPVAGVVCAPALGQIWSAASGAGAMLDGRAVRAPARTSLADARCSGPKPMIAALGLASGAALAAQPRIPSLALRLVAVANGGLDIALAAAHSHDWDIAAADLILQEAGAELVEMNAGPLLYNRAEIKRGALLAAPISLMPEALAAARSKRFVQAA